MSSDPSSEVGLRQAVEENLEDYVDRIVYSDCLKECGDVNGGDLQRDAADGVFG